MAIEGNQADVLCLAYDTRDDFVAAFDPRTGQAPTAHLTAGDYRLLVRSTSVAAQSIPFVVREGETTQVHLKLGTGVHQTFELESPRGIPDRALLTIRRGKELLARPPLSRADGQSVAGEVCLLPGDYQVIVTTEGRELASALFTVGTSASPPLRLVLP